MPRLAANIYLETSLDGLSLGLIRTAKGLIAIDLPGTAAAAEAWAYQIHQLDKTPLRAIILTDAHPDRIFAGPWFTAPVISHDWTAAALASHRKRPPPLLQERLQAARSSAEETLPRIQMSFSQRMALIIGSTEIILEHAPGPTPGNLIVRLPADEILFSGDLVQTAMPDPARLLPEVDVGQWQHSLIKLVDSLQPAEQLITSRGAPVDRTTAVAFAHQLAQLSLMDS
jgi:glyoxylase-like metal-dependent hydrolase (beta-lactamase superfamily II)